MRARSWGRAAICLEYYTERLFDSRKQASRTFFCTDVIAETFREVSASANGGLDPAALSRLEELRTRRQQAEQAARSLLGLHDPESPFVKSELKRLNAEMKSLFAVNPTR